jgi:CheY-like chemotaxis protein
MTQATPQHGGPGLRVFLVEDEALIAMYVEDLLTELGYRVVATAGRLEDALRIASQGSFDIAVLDMNLGGELTHPVARVIHGLGIPFVYVTGYGTTGADVPAAAPTLQKPFVREALQAVMRRALGAA